MSRMGVAATVRVEVHVGSLSPSGHASGHPLPGQWPIPFITWKEPVLSSAAAQRLDQKVIYAALGRRRFARRGLPCFGCSDAFM